MLRDKRSEFEQAFVDEARRLAGVETNPDAAREVVLPGADGQVRREESPPGLPAAASPTSANR
jgi:hypothetical protein